jgi:putative hemin transport protein
MLVTDPDLAARWSRLRDEIPSLRIRDAAVSLGVSEAELVRSAWAAPPPPSTAIGARS